MACSPSSITVIRAGRPPAQGSGYGGGGGGGSKAKWWGGDREGSNPLLQNWASLIYSKNLGLVERIQNVCYKKGHVGFFCHLKI